MDYEFNSMNDWWRVEGQLRRQICTICDFSNKKQLKKMLQNLQHSIDELSRCEITLRRTHNSHDYLAQLQTVREEIVHLLQHITFATLIDTKPE